MASPQIRTESTGTPTRRAIRRATSAPARAWVYSKYALRHPWHLFALLVTTGSFTFVLGPRFALIAAAGIELLVIGFVSRLPCFRELVEAQLRAAEAKRCAEARARLLRRMSDDHQRELTRLELVVDRIREMRAVHGAAALLAVDDCVRLLASYVRLAITHTTARECLAAVNRHALDEEMRSLEVACASGPPHAREVTEGRLLVAQRRAQTWDESRACLEAIAQRLALIADLVQLTHEQFAAPPDCSGMGDEVGALVAQVDGRRCAIAESAEFAIAETVDPLVLDLGRLDARR